ncbi:glycosyltransferase [Secundilactobacillus odoratitofui DSM 19909 = JCM 15043]|uniref:Glycosyltransferase n=2 Tax=Secundilactobacillus odoratitofui TaxID=480930 RepID=A0A0R1LLR8_9LACO|nr:glycosyltransferase [Secundilactobacillus odoratitofui DSM 19909 = JCM 15043]
MMNFFLNRAMGIGNSGVEHAEFYRAKRFEQAGLPYRFVFTDLVPELHVAMAKWHIKNQNVINMWEYFVLGDDYLKHGVTNAVSATSQMVIDDTNTNRKQDEITDSGIHIVRHFVKYPATKGDILIVSTARVELYNQVTGERRATFETIEDDHENHVILNIHLFNQNGRHLFFRNEVMLQRYFLTQLDAAFEGDSTFIIDRDEITEAALLNHRPEGAHIVEVIHADHLSDRDDPTHPLWNNYYEYMLTHLEAVDRVVVATELQRQDLLIDFPEDADKFVTIPVGGIRDQQALHTSDKRGVPLKLVSISRLADEKHIDFAIKAVTQLHDAGEAITLDVYGQGGEQQHLEDVIHAGHAEAYVQLKGQTHTPATIYPKYDAFISASYSEGFGLTYIEALNAMLPVITFKARFGALELIRDGENGFLQDFKRGDETYNVAQLVSGIKRLLAADYTTLHKNTQAGIDKYRDANIAKEWEALLHAL